MEQIRKILLENVLNVQEILVKKLPTNDEYKKILKKQHRTLIKVIKQIDNLPSASQVRLNADEMVDSEFDKWFNENFKK